MNYKLSLNKYSCNYIDITRIIGIFLVILGHTHYNDETILIKNFIYLFHMPLFFIISGILHTDSFKKSIRFFLGMVLIYFLYNLPWFFESKNNIIRTLSFNHIPNIPTWFFITLGFIKIICYKLTIQRSLIIIFITFLFLFYIEKTDTKYYILSSVCMSIPFYISGFYLRKHLNNIKINYAVILLMFAILVLSAFIVGRVDTYSGSYKYSYLLFFTIAYIGSIMVLGLSKKLILIINDRYNDFIYIISRGSAFIVATHIVICNLYINHFKIDNIVINIIFSLFLLVIYYPINNIIIRKYQFLLGKIDII